MNKKNTQKGYSLIEMIIYVSIFAVLSVVVVNSFSVVISSFVESRTNRDLLESGNTVLEKISREIRLASSVDTAGSTLGSSPGVLQLNSVDSSNNARVVKFVFENNTLNIYENNTLTGSLIGNNETITSAIFRKITTSAGTAIKVELTLKDTRGKRQRTENFYDTIILRGDY